MSNTPVTRLARRKAFWCLHLYAVADWSDEQNRATFGACFTPHGHGHDYEMDVFFEGPVDPVTGMVMNLIDVDRLLDEVVEPVRGKHLNFEVPEFETKVPTTENLAAWLSERVIARLPAPTKLVKLRLYENADLWVDVWN